MANGSKRERRIYAAASAAKAKTFDGSSELLDTFLKATHNQT